MSVLIFFPVLGGLSLLFLERKTGTLRLAALVIAFLELLFTLPLLVLFDRTSHLPQFTENHVEKIRMIHEFLSENLSERITIDDLS